MSDKQNMHDEVDGLVAAWRRERPDLDIAPLEVLSRISRLSRQLDIARRAAFAEHGLETWGFDVLAALRRDTGDFVIVINAGEIALTGSKSANKLAFRHSGYPGGLTATTYADMMATHPTRAVEKAIRGMLPKNSLGRSQITKLKVYAGAEHPHAAQNPTPYSINQVSQI
jgi:hypothetical protein